jgi:hypothetical protein
MAKPSVDELMAVESRLNRSLVACVLAVLASLAAPFLALVPIPIVSTIIGVSPLSIKFLLGGQLQAAIRARTFED